MSHIPDKVADHVGDVSRLGSTHIRKRFCRAVDARSVGAKLFAVEIDRGMKPFGDVTKGLSLWLDRVVASAFRFEDAVRRPRAFQIVEGDDESFVVQAARGRAATHVVDFPLRLAEGRFVDARGEAMLPQLAGAEIEIRLASRRFVFRPLELPRKAVGFVEAIVHAQIDRLTPWTAAQAAFGVEADGRARGLELDICRAITSVVLGPRGRLEFRRYDSLKPFDEVRAGVDDVSLLTGREMIDNTLTGQMIPGPAVFIESTSIMVPAESTFRHVADLSGRPICFALLQRAQDHLSAWFEPHHLTFVRMGFQEDVEMNDAYHVRYCHGLAGETTTLADTRTDTDIAKSKHRLLPEALAAYPILSTTSVRDGEWAAIVDWTIQTLMRADAPTSSWMVGGVDSLRVHAPELNLEEGWQKRLATLIGGYGDIYDRNLGEKSELKLPRGLNAGVDDGGALVAPYSE